MDHDNIGYDERFMQRALELSRRALELPGTEPFGAVVVDGGRIIGEGLNHARAHADPTSHGEIEAIRDACRRSGRLDLTGCELYTSCEPCALCVAAMQIVGIARLYYAASLHQSAAAFAALGPQHRGDIDVERLRQQVGLTVDQRDMPAAQRLDGEAVGILEAWAAQRTGRA